MNQHTPAPAASPRALIKEAIAGLEQKFGADAVFSECIKLMTACEIMRRSEHPAQILSAQEAH